MNSRRSVMIILAAGVLVLLLAFTSWIVSSRSVAKTTDASPTLIRSVQKQVDGRVLPSDEPRMSREEIRARAFSILSLPSQRDRLREFCELLRHVTSENEGAIRDAAEILRRREGRQPESALLLLKAHLERLAKGASQAQVPPVTVASGEVVEGLKTLSEVADEVEKMRRFFQLLSKIDAENWREAIAAIDKPGVGRSPLVQSRFSILLAHIGETLGPLAVEEPSVSVRFYLGDILQGWAENSPTAALEWLARQGEPRKEISHFGVACGICASDPHRAWSLLTTSADGTKIRLAASADYMVYQIAERSGIRAAQAFFDVMRRDPRTDKQTIQKAFNKLSVARELMLFRATREDALAALDWLDAYLPSGVDPSPSFVAAAAQLAPEQTKAWLDRRREQMKPAVVSGR